MTLNEKIKFLRQKEGLSQEKLAGKLEVTRQTVVNWEKGTTPTPYLLNQIAILFNVELNSLILDEEDLKFLPKLEEASKPLETSNPKEEPSYTCRKTCLCSKLVIGSFGTIFSYAMFLFYLILSKKQSVDYTFDIYFWLILSIVFFILGLTGYLKRKFSRIIFFKNKFIIQSGVFQKRYSECKFIGYKNIHISQSFFGKLFDYGNILIDGIPHKLFLEGVKSPYQLREFIISFYK